MSCDLISSLEIFPFSVLFRSFSELLELVTLSEKLEVRHTLHSLQIVLQRLELRENGIDLPSRRYATALCMLVDLGFGLSNGVL